METFSLYELGRLLALVRIDTAISLAEYVLDEFTLRIDDLYDLRHQDSWNRRLFLRIVYELKRVHQFVSAERQDELARLRFILGCDEPEYQSSHFPKRWSFVRRLLPRKIQCQCFEPTYNDLLSAHTETLRQPRTRAIRWWLNSLFAFRITIALVDCFRLWVFRLD